MLKMLNLYNIHKLQVASFMFKVNHSMLPVYLCNICLLLTVVFTCIILDIAMIIIGNLIELV